MEQQKDFEALAKEYLKLRGFNLTKDVEQNFIALCKTFKADANKNEIYLLPQKEKNKDDTYKDTYKVILGRDLYVRMADENPKFDGFQVYPFYENDIIVPDLQNGYSIQVNASNRGNLKGAFGICMKKNVRLPYVKMVLLSEYKQQFGLWTSKPNTMIEKVCTAQLLRLAFPDVFNGTYDESENWIDTSEKATENIGYKVEQKQSAPTPQTPKKTFEEHKAEGFKDIKAYIDSLPNGLVGTDGNALKDSLKNALNKDTSETTYNAIVQRIKAEKEAA